MKTLDRDWMRPWGSALPMRLAAVMPGVLPLAGPADVAGQDLRVAMHVDTTQIHLGDPLAVRLEVDHPADWTVRWTDSLDAAPFEVLDYRAAPPAAAPDGSGSRSVAGLVVTSFELGELEIPPIAIDVAGPEGAVRTLVTDPYRVGVVSVGLDESGDIREIRGPLAMARSWWPLIPWLLLAAAAGAGALLLHRRRRKRPIAEPTAPKASPRPHRLVALEALADLERSSLLERGHVKVWHVRVSEIVRAYVEGQLRVPALEMTTREVVAGLQGAALGREIVGSFHTFLARCDLVKFAKLRPGADSSRELIGKARELVERTSGSRTAVRRPEGEADESAGDGP